MGLKYGGVVLSDPFRSPWPEAVQSVAEWVESHYSLARAFPLWERLCHSSRPNLAWLYDGNPRWLESAALSMTTATGILEDAKLRLNTLVWPKGACRWAHFHTLVSQATLAGVRGAVGENYQALELEMSYWNEARVRVDRIRTNLYMLPARPVAGSDLSLLTLVDARYFSWNPVDITIVEGETTWAGLIGAAAAGCGLSVSIETMIEGVASDIVNEDYLYPGGLYAGHYEHAPPLLDAVLAAVGLRLARKLDGVCVAQDSRRAQLVAAANAGMGKFPLGGGEFSYTANNDAIAMVPETFVLQMVKANGGNIDPSDPYYSESVSLFDLSERQANDDHDLPEFKGINGNAFTKTQFDGMVAEFAGGLNPVNAAEITDLAEQAAMDWWLYQRVLYDQGWIGILNFTPEGQSDRIEWQYRRDGVSTRMVPGDIAWGMWGHIGTYPTPSRSAWCASFNANPELTACFSERPSKREAAWCATFDADPDLTACLVERGREDHSWCATFNADPDLESCLGGVLSIGYGGTASGTALNNNQIMVSSAGKIVEGGAMSDGYLMIGATGSAPVPAALTAGSGIGIANGAGSITISSTGTGAGYLSGSGPPSPLAATAGERYYDTTNFVNWYKFGAADTDWTIISGTAYDMLGPLVYSRVAITGGTSISANQSINHTLGSSGPYTVTLPAAAAFDGQHYGFQALTTLSGIATLDGDSSEVIISSGGPSGLTFPMVACENVVIEGAEGAWRTISEVLANFFFQATKDDAQTIATATPTLVAYDDKQWDRGGAGTCYNAGTYEYTPLAPGIYRFSAVATFDDLPDGTTARLLLYKNGSLYRILDQVTVGGTADCTLSGTATVSMNGTTDDVEIYIEQNSGGNVDTLASATGMVFEGERLCRWTS